LDRIIATSIERLWGFYGRQHPFLSVRAVPITWNFLVIFRRNACNPISVIQNWAAQGV